MEDTMNKKTGNLLMVWVCLMGLHPFELHAQEEPLEAPPPQMAPRVTSINFRNESLDAVVKTIGKLTGKSFIIKDELSRQKITIIAEEEVTIEEAYRAFLSALEMNGLTVVPVGKFLKIVNSNDAARQSLDTYAGKYAPSSDGYITRIYHLKYISASEVQRALQSILNRGALIDYAPTNSLIITDTGANINRLIEILEHLDIKGFEEKLEVIKIMYASAKEVADQLNNFYQVSQSRDPRFPPSRFAPLPSGEGGGGEVISKIIADPRTNSIIVKANDQGIAKLKELIQKLDVDIGGGGGIHVIYLQNSQAKNVAATLTGLTAGKGASRPGLPGLPQPAAGSMDFEGEVKVMPDEETNSLVITASPQDFEVIKGVVSKLDIPRRQVFVEAYILEVNVTKNEELGVSYTAGVPAPGFKNGLVGGFAGTQPSSLDVILDPTKLLSKGAGVLGFVTKQSTEIELPDGSKRNIPNATALIRALASDANANLLSAPQLLALDNVEAEIEVSEKIPTVASTSVTSTGLQQQNINREPIGLTLKITPQINAESELIRLKIDQTIEDISNRRPPSDISGQTFASTKRKMATTVLVKNSDTVVIGGLLRDNVTETTDKIPLLGDIPIIGWLFKSRAKNIVKTNLLLLLTPTIIKADGDYRKLFDKKIKEQQEFIDKNYSQKDRKTIYMNRLQPPKK